MAVRIIKLNTKTIVTNPPPPPQPKVISIEPTEHPPNETIQAGTI